MNAIEVKDITKKYDSFRLNHVSLQIPEGSIYGLIGENGAGKTTTMKMILSLVMPTSGEILINGENITKNKQYLNQIG